MAWHIDPRFWAPWITLAYRCWCSTLRYSEVHRKRVEETEAQGTTMVFALWHDELFPLPWLRRELRLVTVVSQSTDGEILAGVLQRLGLTTARGSSRRGGLQALLTMARMMREHGAHAVITVDGPKGPRHKAKDGAIYLAHKTPALIVPVRVFMPHAKRFQKAWDRFQLPVPGSRCRVVYGCPYGLETEKLTAQVLNQEKERLEHKLNALTWDGEKEQGAG